MGAMCAASQCGLWWTTSSGGSHPRLSNAQETHTHVLQSQHCGICSGPAHKSCKWLAVCCRAEGWDKKFGLYNFDINDPEKRRTLHETSKVDFCIPVDMQSFTRAQLRAVSSRAASMIKGAFHTRCRCWVRSTRRSQTGSGQHANTGRTASSQTANRRRLSTCRRRRSLHETT